MIIAEPIPTIPEDQNETTLALDDGRYTISFTAETVKERGASGDILVMWDNSKVLTLEDVRAGSVVIPTSAISTWQKPEVAYHAGRIGMLIISASETVVGNAITSDATFKIRFSDTELSDSQRKLAWVVVSRIRGIIHPTRILDGKIYRYRKTKKTLTGKSHTALTGRRDLFFGQVKLQNEVDQDVVNYLNALQKAKSALIIPAGRHPDFDMSLRVYRQPGFMRNMTVDRFTGWSSSEDLDTSGINGSLRLAEIATEAPASGGEIMTFGEFKHDSTIIKNAMDQYGVNTGLFLRNRGNWETATAYVATDIVYHSNKFWLCLNAHTSSSSNAPSSTATNWVQIGGGTSSVGATAFTALSDAPNSIAANKILQGNADGDALIFGDLVSDFLKSADLVGKANEYSYTGLTNQAITDYRGEMLIGTNTSGVPTTAQLVQNFSGAPASGTLVLGGSSYINHGEGWQARAAADFTSPIYIRPVSPHTEDVYYKFTFTGQFNSTGAGNAKRYYKNGTFEKIGSGNFQNAGYILTVQDYAPTTLDLVIPVDAVAGLGAWLQTKAGDGLEYVNGLFRIKLDGSSVKRSASGIKIDLGSGLELDGSGNVAVKLDPASNNSLTLGPAGLLNTGSAVDLTPYVRKSDLEGKSTDTFNDFSTSPLWTAAGDHEDALWITSDATGAPNAANVRLTLGSIADGAGTLIFGRATFNRAGDTLSDHDYTTLTSPIYLYPFDPPSPGNAIKFTFTGSFTKVGTGSNAYYYANGMIERIGNLQGTGVTFRVQDRIPTTLDILLPPKAIGHPPWLEAEIGDGVEIVDGKIRVKIDGLTLTRAAGGMKVTDNTYVPYNALAGKSGDYGYAMSIAAFETADSDFVKGSLGFSNQTSGIPSAAGQAAIGANPNNLGATGTLLLSAFSEKHYNTGFDNEEFEPRNDSDFTSPMYLRPLSPHIPDAYLKVTWTGGLDPRRSGDSRYFYKSVSFEKVGTLPTQVFQWEIQDRIPSSFPIVIPWGAIKGVPDPRIVIEKDGTAITGGPARVLNFKGANITIVNKTGDPTTKEITITTTGGTPYVLTVDDLLDLFKSTRVTGDRGKLLGISTTDQDGVVLRDYPSEYSLDADKLLDVFKTTRVTGDRGKLLGISSSDQDGVALFDQYTLDADKLLDVFKATRVTGDRGKILSISSTDENALALTDPSMGGGGTITDTDINVLVPGEESTTAGASRQAIAETLEEERVFNLNSIVQWLGDVGDPAIRTFERDRIFTLDRTTADAADTTNNPTYDPGELNETEFTSADDDDYRGTSPPGSATVGDYYFAPSANAGGGYTGRMWIYRTSPTQAVGMNMQDFRNALGTGYGWVRMRTNGITFDKSNSSSAMVIGRGTIDQITKAIAAGIGGYDPSITYLFYNTATSRVEKFSTFTKADNVVVAAPGSDRYNRGVIAFAPVSPGFSPTNAVLKFRFKYKEGNWGCYFFFGSGVSNAANPPVASASNEAQITRGVGAFIVLNSATSIKFDWKQYKGTTANMTAGTHANFFRGGSPMGTSSITVNKRNIASIQRSGAAITITWQSTVSIGVDLSDSAFDFRFESSGNSFTLYINGVEICELRYISGEYPFEIDPATGNYRFPARVGDYYGFVTNNDSDAMEMRVLPPLEIASKSNKIELLPGSVLGSFVENGGITDEKLAAAIPRFRGLWTAGTYRVGDIVYKTISSVVRIFVCRVARTVLNTDPPETDTSSWIEIGAADLPSATVTTKGDEYVETNVFPTASQTAAGAYTATRYTVASAAPSGMIQETASGQEYKLRIPNKTPSGDVPGLLFEALTGTAETVVDEMFIPWGALQATGTLSADVGWELRFGNNQSIRVVYLGEANHDYVYFVGDGKGLPANAKVRISAWKIGVALNSSMTPTI